MMKKRKTKNEIFFEETPHTEKKLLDGKKVDQFNTALAKVAREYKYGKCVDLTELKILLSDVDIDLFKEELNKLKNLKDLSLEEIKSCLKEIDKSTTAKVIEMGRNDR